MNDLSPDRHLEAAADAHQERQDAPTCDWCPSIGPLRRFHNITTACESCADDLTVICGDCGADDMVCPDEGPDYCVFCQSVERGVSIDWDEGEPVTDARERQADIAAEERADLNAFQGD